MKFGKDFIWGAATAAYQIEGAACEDGKGLSVWDTFCKEPGRIFEGHSGDTACDHYHRWRDDVKLMKELGLRAYRFSLSWPRIMPEGAGRVNDKGIQFYSGLIDTLLENGITPYITLFHWDYPYGLFQRGGWLNPDSPDWFAEYAEAVARSFGDRVKNFFTINEPQCFIGLAYQRTEHAPGILFPRREAMQMAHNVLLGHGKAVQALRAGAANCSIGFASVGRLYHPASDCQEDIEAARSATFDVRPEDWFFSVAWWSDPVFSGSYPKVAELESTMPDIKDGDMQTISQPLDFYGQNVYNSEPAVRDDTRGYRVGTRPVGHAKTAIGWPVTPETLYWTPKFLYERYKKPVFITENGMSCHDAVSLDGCVHDQNRIDFMSSYLKELFRAVNDGVDVRGYFHWSLMDNFEWAKGYDDRFGLIYVDYNSQKRILKDSAYWYRDLLLSQSEK